MNSQPFVIVTQTPFSTFDHLVIGIALVAAMSIMGMRWLLRRLRVVRNADTPQRGTNHDPR
ncbi:MAG: hypothetical protein JJ920_04495 [Roseitalea sp.]|jgi:hypothetical protein|nr:hypothetical protein [Roseitalea sp.]MBO6723062.1 hypothetical protein [Roseitalea sp.]MBO6742147.1 hypothetical protein [Roseitalea sp.]